jgi:hypothetical protein
VAIVEVEDRLLLGLGQPEVARDAAVVLVDAALALAPGVELAAAHAQPADEVAHGQLGLLLPAMNVIDDFVAGVVGNPNSFQV